MKAYEVYIGHIKIGSSSVRLRIFFEPSKFIECVVIIDQQLGINIKQFRKRFKGLILRAIIYAFEKDRFIQYAKGILEGIQLKISPKETRHMADFDLTHSIKNGHVKMFMGMAIKPIIQAMQEFARKDKYKVRKLLKYIAHEIFHYLDSPTIAANAVKMYEIMAEETHLVTSMPTQLYFSGIDAIELVTKMNFTSLNLFLTGCRVEGIARYREREFTQQHRILAKTIREQWRAVVMMFAFENITSDTTHKLIESILPYQIGEHMCIIISLGLLAKRRAGEVRLIVNNQVYPLEYLNELFSKTDVFYITRLPEDVWEHTIEIVARQNPEGFVKVYNAACNRLRLDKSNRVIDWGTYTDVKKILIQSSEMVKAALKKQGYDV